MSEKSELRRSVEDSRRKRRTTILVIAGVAVVALVAGIIGVARTLSGEQAPDDGRLAITIAAGEDNEYHDTIAEVAAEKGLDVTWQNLDDWVLPNTEVAAGTLDANSFQHILFLSNFNVENGEDLQPVFSTIMSRWGIFSPRLGSTDEIEPGSAIGIPDDPSNGGRALFILQDAGLIELDPEAGAYPDTDDIIDNPRDLSFTEITATTIPQQFDDPSLAAVVVGIHYFDPSQNIEIEDALYLDDPDAESSLPYVNVVAARADNLDNPAWDILEEAYDDPRVIEAIEEEFFGTTMRVHVPVETLRETLAELQEEAQQNQGA